MTRIAAAVWITLFGILGTFVMGVVVWAVAGPTLALIIFAAVFILFVWVPFTAGRRGTTKSPPHH